MADDAAIDELISDIDHHLAELLKEAIRRTLDTASLQHDCNRSKCGCIHDAVHRKVDVGFWSPINWPAMVTVVDGEIVELEGEFNRNTEPESWVRGVRSGQINQLKGLLDGAERAKRGLEAEDG